ncbi:MAG: VOC family protein [Bacteroidota bacterium]
MAQYDRTEEDLGNIVALEHVNTRVPDQRLATLFYVMGLGLTRDPYLMTGVGNMWINVGRSQFHLPSGEPQVLRGHTGVVIPDREALLRRLREVAQPLEGTRFAVKEHNDFVEATCPWGNRIRCYEPGPRFGRMMLGMAYVEVDTPPGTVDGIVRFYTSIVRTKATAAESGGVRYARVSVGAGQELIYRETTAPQPVFDGHHIAIYLADFSSPHRWLLQRGLITQESDQHQYRFQDIVDPDDGRLLVTLEHETRSMRHPLYARPLVNRNPAQTNRSYAPGYEELSWSLPVG